MTENKSQQQEQEEISLYAKIVARTEELMNSGRKTLDEALKKAAEDFTTAGDYTREQSERIANFVRRDLGHAAGHLNKTTETVKEAITPQRLAAGAQSFFAKILTTAAGHLSEWAQKAESQLEFKTGEITSPGTMTCKSCQEELHMKRTAKIPPCPKCHKTVFRKSY
jgi:Zn finger protein HypA/HybF involved in hydrogenase expression